MEIISVIISGFALLAAAVNLVLFIREKKRNERHRRVSDQHYVRWFENLETSLSSHEDRIDELFKRLGATCESFCGQTNSIEEKLDDCEYRLSLVEGMCDEECEMRPIFAKRLKNLEDGVVPDYNEAVAAKNAVDDFSAGVMAILTHGNVKKSDTDEEDGPDV